MAVGRDSPAWTFGLNPKAPSPRVPGVGEYDVAGRMVRDGVGTHFSRIGAKPLRPREDVQRLVFGTEAEASKKPGPGAYDVVHKRARRWDVWRPGGAKDHTPRFPESRFLTDAGPGAYIPSEFSGSGPAYSIARRSPKSPDAPDSPGPGQYVEVQLSIRQEDKDAEEGFGKRNSPRFATDTEAPQGPGPGAYPTRVRHSAGKAITLGRQFRPPGWSAKIKEITRFPCELEGDEDAGEECRRGRVGRFRVSLKRFARSTRNRRGRRPSSAPPSSRFRRACARGRRLDSDSNAGGQRRRPRSIAEVVREDGRRRQKAAAAAASAATTSAGKGAVLGSAPQRPPDAKRTPGPTSYRPVTLDEAARKGKVVSIGGTSKRELFQPPPDSPGPEWYAPEIVQGPAMAEGSRRQRRTTARGPESPPTPDARAVPRNRPAHHSTPVQTHVSLANVGTFGSADRFPRDTAPRPGVGQYDLRAAERAAMGASAATPVTLGRKPAGLPYDPSLNRYLRGDGLDTPSAHDYRPEPAAGGAGRSGPGGRAASPPAWSFGGAYKRPRPPDGPGPGRFRPPYSSEDDPCCSSSPPAVRFGAGRQEMSGSVSGVPWGEAEEQAARGDGGGGDAKLYLPERDRMGARLFMRSRPLPRPGQRKE